jgi:hypothetical protein
MLGFVRFWSRLSPRKLSLVTFFALDRDIGTIRAGGRVTSCESMKLRRSTCIVRRSRYYRQPARLPIVLINDVSAPGVATACTRRQRCGNIFRTDKADGGLMRLRRGIHRLL